MSGNKKYNFFGFRFGPLIYIKIDITYHSCGKFTSEIVEGKKRKEFLKTYPIKTIYVSSSRLNCAKNGDFEKYNSNSARCYAWYIWEKGYNGVTELKWFN